jgi:hypothetical protein
MERWEVGLKIGRIKREQGIGPVKGMRAYNEVGQDTTWFGWRSLHAPPLRIEPVCLPRRNPNVPREHPVNENTSAGQYRIERCALGPGGGKKLSVDRSTDHKIVLRIVPV